MVLNGLINTRISSCREMNIDAVGISGVDAGRKGLISVRPYASTTAEPSTTAVGDIDAQHHGADQAARQRPHAGGESAVVR
jgi:hypothetical protein